MKRSRMVWALVITPLIGCADAAQPTTPIESPLPVLSISDGFGLLSVNVTGNARINQFPDPPSGTYTASISGGTTAQYYYEWHVRTCAGWNSCTSSSGGHWDTYTTGVGKNPVTIVTSPAATLLEVKAEVGEWTGDPDFVGRTGISDGKLVFGPAGFGSPSYFNFCSFNPSSYVFTQDTIVSGDTLKIGYTYGKCVGTKVFNPAGPRPKYSQVQQVASVQVTPGTAQLAAGNSVLLSAKAFDSYGTLVNIPVGGWSSSSPGIVSVSTSGLVSGVSTGVAQITAMSNGHSDTAVITVTPPPPSVGITGETTVSAGSFCSWTATASGGSAPYSYLWRIDDDVVGAGSSTYADEHPSQDFVIAVEVVDNAGAVGTASMNVSVQTPGMYCPI